jgi:hypothetical protein
VDPDPGGSTTCGSGGSGYGSGTLGLILAGGEPVPDDDVHLRWKSQRIKILQIFYRLLNSYPSLWIFYWKSQRFDKSLETFGSQIFFLRFLKSIGWYGFSYGFFVVLNLFHLFFALSYYTFDKHKTTFGSILCHLMVSCAPTQSLD